jgi:lrgA family protein
LGEIIVWATGIKLPSSIIGMLFLTLFLKLGWVKLSWVEHLSELLIANLGFFFVPPGVALILYLDLIEKEWFPIVTATIVSTVLVLVVTGHMHQLVIKLERRMIALDLLHHRAHRRQAEEMKQILKEYAEYTEEEQILTTEALQGKDIMDEKEAKL